MSDIVSKLSSVDLPPLPCALDADIYALTSDIATRLNTVIAAYDPGNLIGQLDSLKIILANNIKEAIATKIRDLIPAGMPNSLIADVFSIVEACALGADYECKTKLLATAHKYTSLGSPEEALNAILSFVTGEEVDVCNAIPNIVLFEDGTEATLGLPGKISNSLATVASLPSNITDLAVSRIDSTLKGRTF